jgi:sulfite dehydrogenase (cytochrome) subunit B
MKGPRSRAPLVLTSLALAGAWGLLWGAGGEETIQLQDAPGRDLTTGRCIICHSLEYIPSNAPAMNRAAWQKTIQKMKDRFGAPITDEEAKQILDYLDGSYSGKS